MGGGAAEAPSTPSWCSAELVGAPGRANSPAMSPPLVTVVPEIPLLTASPRKSRAELQRGKDHHSRGRFPGRAGTLVLFSGKRKKRQPERVGELLAQCQALQRAKEACSFLTAHSPCRPRPADPPYLGLL